MAAKGKNSAKASQGRKAAKAKGGKLAPALCNVFGTLLLLGVIALCLPLTVPRIMGYGVYDVVSGSMEPQIPVGSVVYTKDAEPSGVQEGDIIAFYDVGGASDSETGTGVDTAGERLQAGGAAAQDSSGQASGASADSAPEPSESAWWSANSDGTAGVVVHRVVTNRTSLGEFVTKGDANEIEDLNPIPYDAFIGKVERTVPALGAVAAIYASTVGKVYLLLTAACGVMLNLVAGRMRESRRAKAEAEAAARAMRAAARAAADPGAAGAGSNSAASRALDGLPEATATASGGKRKRSLGSKLRAVAIAVLAVVFLGSGGVIGYVNWQYSISDSLYHEASGKYTVPLPEGSIDAPIEVDFDGLHAENPDIVGWIYCADTPIDYPVLQGKNNDQYLHHDYTGAYNIDGSIFVDADNSAGFADSNTIVYGHHMNSGSMFASLVNWADQDFYKKHPVIWLLTPEQNYRIILFSGHHQDAHSSMYDIIAKPGKELNEFLAEALTKTDFDAKSQLADYAAEERGLNRADTTAAADQLDLLGACLADPANVKKLAEGNRYVMLTTCAYLFDNDRYVLHGLLAPA